MRYCLQFASFVSRSAHNIFKQPVPQSTALKGKVKVLPITRHEGPEGE